MKWSIPAKTFLLGEYAAIAGAPAMVLTTTPCFELTLSDSEGLQGIHPESPAGRWWLQHGLTDVGVRWHDPYHGCGGMGASSAQFLGVYLAAKGMQKQTCDREEMLAAYLAHTWTGAGVRPSGYDVLAQSLHGCVYIDRKQSVCRTFTWPFQDLSFFLIHTGKKLPTHEHLQSIVLPSQIDTCIAIVELAKEAFERGDSSQLIVAVNAYHQQLAHMNLVAEHSKQHIDFFRTQTDILAVKGCGAMGADVLLLLVPSAREASVKERLLSTNSHILATSSDLHHS